ncbi:MAG: hypothetical protein ABGX22_26880 [Pirellulaceae bacterium]
MVEDIGQRLRERRLRRWQELIAERLRRGDTREEAVQRAWRWLWGEAF